MCALFIRCITLHSHFSLSYYLSPHDLLHSWISIQPLISLHLAQLCPPLPITRSSLWLLAPQVGDQILEVNGRSFLSIPHDEAVRVLKSSRHLMMTVKDVGRLPHTRTVVGETKWIASSQISESSASSSVAG